MNLRSRFKTGTGSESGRCLSQVLKRLLRHPELPESLCKYFCWSLQALAASACVQRMLFINPILFPDDVCAPEQLVSDFEYWLKFTTEFVHGGAWDDCQQEAFARVDQRLKDMSRGGSLFHEDLWTNDGLYEPPWESVRSLASLALLELGWPVENPPFNRLP